jgi:hypothetical protein
MNIDYSICNALKYRSIDLPQGLVIYDIGCQWITHFQKRLNQSRHLSIPQVMELLVAVGKFHLSAHIRECFALYSLNFMYGSGQVDGEILETLWSAFNLISAPARTMTMASRYQLYDDHMRDSNWRKIMGIGKYRHINIFETNFLFSPLVSTLSKKHKKALDGLIDTSTAYAELSAALDSELIVSWQEQERKAQIERGEALRIYDVQLEQGINLFPIPGFK